MKNSEDAEQAFRAFATAGVSMAEFVAGMQAAIPAITRAWEICEARYREAGAPYGDTLAGITRWYRENYR